MAYRADDPAPLLPPSIRNRLHGWLWKLLGFLLLAACVALSASLLTWSVADPSLTRATSGAARNLMGPPGAMLSDIVMQMLGLAGTFVLLPPLFWALQLLTAAQPPRLRGKLLLAPLAVLFLAGAFSSLPSAPGWPMHHGYGGVLGDLGLGFLASLLAHVNAQRSSAAAGLFYFAAGLMVLMSSLGLSRQELRRICQTGIRTGTGGSLAGLAGWWRDIGSEIRSRRTPPPAPPSHDPLREPPTLRVEPPLEARPEPVPIDEEEQEPADVPVLRDPAFDRVTDHTSEEIARRFAPATAAKARTRASEPPAAAPDLPAAGPAPPLEIAPVATAFRRPPLNLLRRAPAPVGARLSQAELRAQARQLAGLLADFGVRGEVKQTHPGPVITLFEFEPARGVKSARVINLADDIARSMGAASVRAAVLPGRNAIGIELPNTRREKVYLRELLESDAFRTSRAALPLVLGRDIAGAPVVADLARMPHLLVAGTTGAGKSVGINAMILSLIQQLSPDQCRFLMIDPKMLELSVYNGIPHLLCPVVTDPHRAVSALGWVVAEMEERYRRMSTLAVRNIDAFNERLRHAHKRSAPAAQAEAGLAPLPYIVVVVDEFADLMLVAGKEIEAAVQRLAQMARAAGIHLIMATQRPSVDVITGTIKANFPTRVSYKVASKFDSRTILGEQGAEQLLGEGDMLYWNGAGRAMRVHGPFVSDDEVERIATYLRQQGTPRYIEGIGETADAEADEAPSGRTPRGGDGALYARAVGIVRSEHKASASHLQRRLGIGYNRAADLIERMEREGIIGAPGRHGRREVHRRDDAPPDEQW